MERMGSGNSLHRVIPEDQVIDVSVTTAGGTSQGGSKICRGAPCDFADAGSSSDDAKERQASMKKLMAVVVLCVIFMSIEVAGGIMANSLAILTDAAHLLSDVASFAISLFSLWAAGWEATPRQTYGFFRIEILGALVSMQLIWLLTGMLVYEAIVRLLNDTGEVHGSLMFAVAAFGLIVNLIMAFLLGHDHDHDHGAHSHDHDRGHMHGQEAHFAGHSHGHDDHDNEHKHGYEIDITAHHQVIRQPKLNDEKQPLLEYQEGVEDHHVDTCNNVQRKRNINVQGAYLHVLGDTIQSIGVMIGGAIIWYRPEWKIIDLICTLIFSVVVLATTIKMLRSVLEILMESTPREIDATRLEKGLCNMDGVVAIHELHIWAITVGKVLLACHVTITPDADADSVLDEVVGYINREYNISHVTVQIERQYT